MRPAGGGKHHHRRGRDIQREPPAAVHMRSTVAAEPKPAGRPLPSVEPWLLRAPACVQQAWLEEGVESVLDLAFLYEDRNSLREHLRVKVLDISIPDISAAAKIWEEVRGEAGRVSGDVAKSLCPSRRCTPTSTPAAAPAS